MKNAEMHENANIPEQVQSPSQQPAADRAGAKLLEEYEARLGVARERFDQHPAVRALFRDPIDPVKLEAFLIPAQGRVAFTDVFGPAIECSGRITG